MGQKFVGTRISFDRFHPINTRKIFPKIHDNNVKLIGAAAEAKEIGKAYYIKKTTIRLDSSYVIESMENIIMNKDKFMELLASKLGSGLIRHLNGKL